MSFVETPPSIRWETIEGRRVPIITTECVVTLTHTETGKEYNSDAEAEADVNDPNTTTETKHIRRDVELRVAQVPLGSDSK